jgi:ABC-type hemin transport system substrate-binding protein
MIQETLAKIQARIEKVGSLKEENKAELLNLLSTLESEIAELSKTHFEHAESITGFTEISTHEATRQEPDPQLLKLSLDGLSASVQGFETSHPKLVEIVNAISLMLSNSGV